MLTFHTPEGCRGLANHHSGSLVVLKGLTNWKLLTGSKTLREERTDKLENQCSIVVIT
jgi:hypothetical protein